MHIKVIAAAEKEPDFLSRQIMLADNQQYSHVLIQYGEIIFHAVGKGVVQEYASDFFKDHIAVKTFNIPLLCSDDFFLGFVRGSLGKSYSQGQVASMAIGRIDANGDGAVICSELVGIVITEMCGYTLEGGQDSWRPIHCVTALETQKLEV